MAPDFVRRLSRKTRQKKPGKNSLRKRQSADHTNFFVHRFFGDSGHMVVQKSLSFRGWGHQVLQHTFRRTTTHQGLTCFYALRLMAPPGKFSKPLAFLLNDKTFVDPPAHYLPKEEKGDHLLLLRMQIREGPPWIRVL